MSCKIFLKVLNDLKDLSGFKDSSGPFFAHSPSLEGEFSILHFQLSTLFRIFVD